VKDASRLCADYDYANNVLLAAAAADDDDNDDDDNVLMEACIDGVYP